MGITKIERKLRKDRIVSAKRKALLKRITAKPVIKNVDVEAIKKSFEEKKSA